ncbi:MAG: hypothetical protein JWP76_3038 [Dactylosporangium sp.]|nr:hypothetical protein [Dactylosporangium sp.]
MTEREPVPDDEETPLWEWREAMQPRLARLQAFEVPGFPLDYTRASLDLLEAEVLARYPFDDRPGSRASFTEAAMGYLGEALLSIAGGTWEWDDDNGMPVANFDPQLHLAPVSPLHLIVEAGQRRTGGEFARVQAALEQAVADRRAVEPSWSPTKEPTPGLDKVPRPEGSPFLDRWLPERQKVFPQWLADHAQGLDGWDFSAESLDLLQAVVLDHLKTLEDFGRPENHDLVDGAVWYLGEVFGREAGTHWSYIDGEPSPDNMWIGRPFVERLTPRENSTVPYYTLRITVLNAEPGYLRGRLAFFND